MKIKKNQEEFIIIPELLSLTTNVDYLFHFILGPFMYKFFSRGKTKLNFSFIAKKNIQKPLELNTRFEHFWGRDNDKRVYYEHPFLGKIKSTFVVKLNNSGTIINFS